MFKWRKNGLLFKPAGINYWMNTHAQVPYTLDLGGIIRTYFSTRESIDNRGMFRSYSGYVDLDKNNLSSIIEVSDNPIIQLGGRGQFDEFGSMAGSVIAHNEKYYLYYCGWTRCESVPYNWAIGLAISDDAKTFYPNGRGPLLGAITNEPYLQACPIVYKISNDDWHMFYLSGIKWLTHSGKLESQYLLMHASSRNGFEWVRNGIPIIPTVVPDECQTSASIFYWEGRFHLFFSYRHGIQFREDAQRGYRIGYAYSSDLLHWTRNDSQAGIDVSDTGWDSQMLAYPHVFEVNGQMHMFYCGNNFGRDGFGWATLDC